MGEAQPLPAVVVAGLGRCGSSLTMQMLQAGGMDCVGTFPDFEEQPAVDGPFDPAWLAACAGKAVKILNPQWCGLPAEVPGMVIWLDRDAREQARSQAKFAHLVAGMPRANRQHVLRWERGLAFDRARAVSALPPSWRRLTLRYEALIERPRMACAGLAAFLSPYWPSLDVEAMRRAVRKGDASCAAGVDMEERLISEAAT